MNVDSTLRSPDRMSLFTIIPAALQQFTPRIMLSKVQPQYSRDRQAPRSLSGGGGGAAVVTNNSNHPRYHLHCCIYFKLTLKWSMVSTLSAKFFLLNSLCKSASTTYRSLTIWSHNQLTRNRCCIEAQSQKTQPSDNTSTSGHGDGSVCRSVQQRQPCQRCSRCDCTSWAKQTKTPQTAGSSSTLPPSPRVPLDSWDHHFVVDRTHYLLLLRHGNSIYLSTHIGSSPCTPSHSPTKNSSGPSPRLSISIYNIAMQVVDCLPHPLANPVSAGPTTTMSNPTMVASTHPPPRDPSTYYQKRETRTRQPSHSHASPNAPNTLPTPTPQRTSCLSTLLYPHIQQLFYHV
ncbi:hypothetical protein BASA83_003996 [Batrachochytrium salamandrivorans]|nr:hypothetical protein BASA83_003996 [Batrachochytrium salamandrivorans]